MSLVGIGEIGEKDFEFLDYLFNEYIPFYDEIWLFGTGKYASAFTRYLQTCDINVDGYVVSNTNYKNIQGKRILSINEFKKYKNTRGSKIALLLTIHSRYYGEVYPYLMTLGKDVCFIKTAYLEYAQEHCGEIDDIILSVPLTEFCQGILCYGCTSCVPVIEQKYSYNFEQFCTDMTKIHSLIGLKIKYINFTGGDVFLHPRLIEIVEYTRNLYKNIPINFSINGVLLSKQTKEFWHRLGKCDVDLNWTLYPIQYPDLEETMNVITKINGVRLNIIGDSSGEEKNSWKLPYSFEKQNQYDWLFCRHHKCSNNVLIMYQNTLGVCHPHRGLIHLEKKFGDKFTEEFKNAITKFNEEILKINEIENKDEIVEYMRKRPSMCDYCALRERKNMGKWLKSEGKFEEWFVHSK